MIDPSSSEEDTDDEHGTGHHVGHHPTSHHHHHTSPYTHPVRAVVRYFLKNRYLWRLLLFSGRAIAVSPTSSARIGVGKWEFGSTCCECADYATFIITL